MDKSKKYIIKTYGCQMNELDSERISYMLSNLGYEETDVLSDANLIIYNTCIVRKNAELKVYGHIGAMKALKLENPDLVIAVCGCMMQIEDSQLEIKNKYPQVDIVFGTKNITSFPYLLEQHELSNERIFEVEESDDIDEVQKAVRKNNFSAYINIIYGCDNFCSYCIVPYTRGRESSRDTDSILKEIESLAEEGYKEITLLGQNVNSYGKDLHPCCSFAELLRKASQIDGIERIRFMSSHPKDLSNELIDEIARNDKICKHIHLPLQSGSTDILKAMNRTYSKDDYLNLVDRIKNKIPDVSLTTDLIIGFPGETEQDNEDTIEVIKNTQFDQCYIFKYSRRAGTKAADMANQIEESVKTERFNRVLEEINNSSKNKNAKYINTIQRVLVEGSSKTDEDKFTGRTDTNKIVNFEGDSSMIGTMVDIKITGCTSFALEGELA